MSVGGSLAIRQRKEDKEENMNEVSSIFKQSLLTVEVNDVRDINEAQEEGNRGHLQCRRSNDQDIDSVEEDDSSHSMIVQEFEKEIRKENNEVDSDDNSGNVEYIIIIEEEQQEISLNRLSQLSEESSLDTSFIDH